MCNISYTGVFKALIKLIICAQNWNFKSGKYSASMHIYGR